MVHQRPDTGPVWRLFCCPQPWRYPGGRLGGQTLPGLCEAWMPNASLQGRIHGGSREGLPAQASGLCRQHNA